MTVKREGGAPGREEREADPVSASEERRGGNSINDREGEWECIRLTKRRRKKKGICNGDERTNTIPSLCVLTSDKSRNFRLGGVNLAGY